MRCNAFLHHRLLTLQCKTLFIQKAPLTQPEKGKNRPFEPSEEGPKASLITLPIGVVHTLRFNPASSG